LRHTKGVFLLALFAKEHGFENVFVPKDSAFEASVIKTINVYPVESLNQLLRHFSGKKIIERACAPPEGAQSAQVGVAEFDMAEILSQEQAKRAMEIAAAGGHNILLAGSPGAGKTMLARALPGILPLLTSEESLEVTKIYSAAGQIPANSSLIKTRPVRSPHHSASQVGLIGGGTRPQPGEISLAHRGVLFLDEFNEFSRQVLESLRQPLEDGNIIVARSRGRINFPARFMLVASANPCPCGYLHHPKKQCICSQQQIRKYQKRISGPILDRIDLHVEVPAVDTRELAERNIPSAEKSVIIRQRVAQARKAQEKRFLEEEIFSNAEMKNSHIKKYCFLSKEVEQFLQQASLKFQLSARSYLKMIKIARSIADLSEVSDARARQSRVKGQEESNPSSPIQINHMAEALQYRAKTYES
jgi:magnesium chelatase family protein